MKGGALALGAAAIALAGGAAVRLVQGYRRGQAFELEVANIGGDHWLSVPAAADFLAMRAAAEAAGVPLVVNTAWRDNDWQARLYAAWKAGTGNLAAAPGYSNHQEGRSVDISTTDARGRTGREGAVWQWLAANAARWNFRNDVASEPWHWTHYPPGGTTA